MSRKPRHPDDDDALVGAIVFEARGIPEFLQFVHRIRAVAANIQRGRLKDPAKILDRLNFALEEVAQGQEPPDPNDPLESLPPPASNTDDAEEQ